MNEFEQHDSLWSDRLQDLLDGDLDATERSSVEAHLSVCARCRRQHAQLKRLDAKLSARLDAPVLDRSFDRQLYARIDALESRARDDAQRIADREREINLASLYRGWRRKLLTLAGGALAGLAVAIAFVAAIGAPDVTSALVGMTEGLVLPATDGLHTLAAALIGAALGGALSSWVLE